ncbi:conserved hypothetical protein [Nitrosopumilaceae archaeon]|nr:conserved hypothetical protein [Nitrosopumilaceae archaeon]
MGRKFTANEEWAIRALMKECEYTREEAIIRMKSGMA